MFFHTHYIEDFPNTDSYKFLYFGVDNLLFFQPKFLSLCIYIYYYLYTEE